ncbi:MAG: hypothetical protein US83_C0004G0030 [Candidatus Falkowbacteria bacterium GW2011_GWC2_38_22]|uniref:Uncharacterized protein n=1 Tax=Candidatus Falkowbacteria bacterium GW2011_GWE1_38_31 TaxID=1618638 RepID=A0A0G0JVH1_9BACT|nr:MAG: hypothetical protein US73_C0002G0087 [Candidatus Falkowbacteria bacterium GW2011_GWF2_38_1205]KKQ61646.1 MAG: hypothetical protein US83_C0004G0030 [Candidatus Falkowbacteria bacterium GW2011_GWC2_38_22]KKQ63739.1 MAG: hypothetical protein US84_C0004G0087 [Candidatus Falkowbacteria bacterium GW2011_GWF1_38_22]KKQ65845.1 MAG: hypothetical protein US87_C0004G0030 [Candidatus Falkowbacteria bacterium GW2011_GWE2_38_254]KKQ70602.1 MAG: hypothetical protein US91_C0004G0087 [Candidatus Falkowb
MTNDMALKKIKKNFWEKIFNYPSFNRRFWFALILVLLIFCIILSILLFINKINETSNQIAIINLIIQSATLVLGICATYYALRQLVETRFTGLDEAGMREIKRGHYSRAFEKWREAFYIRPEAGVFTNLCESLLLIGDYDNFDQYIQISQDDRFKKKIFQESSDQITLLYLRAVRHLLVKNQGEAEVQITEIIKITKDNSLLGFGWDFMDLRSSIAYQNVNGECKNIAENLISYLSKTILPNRKKDFEQGNFSSQANEQILENTNQNN